MDLVTYVVRAYVGLRLGSVDLWELKLPVDPGYPWSMTELEIRLVGPVPFGVEQFRVEVRHSGLELRISSRNAEGTIATHRRPWTQADIDPLVLVLRESLQFNASKAARS